MKNVRLTLAIAGVLALSTSVHAQFAGTVVSYNSGSGFAAGFTNASAALGAPSSGSGVTPFAPPFSKSQIVSLGAGGELTLQLTTPIVNDPSHPFGLDFTIFGNTFFALSGSTATGTLGGNNTGSTLVEVSADDVNWFTLNPSLAPTVDGLFPTDGIGNPQLPVDPSLNAASFAGQNLAGIRSLYDGSAGGTGFDLSWAEDGSGNSVDLPSADFVRIDVVSGKSEVDAVSVVPEPSALALILTGALLLWFHVKKQKTQPTGIMRLHLILLSGLLMASSVDATTITEKFTSDPANNGWKIFGDTNLFRWDPVNQNLAVTWDSSQTNSYFYRPLGTVLAIDDDFSVEFDLNLTDATAGGYGSELAVGFLHLTDATSPDFLRTSGSSPNVAEFDYFPPSMIAPSVNGTLIDASNNFYFGFDSVPLDPGVTYHVRVAHAAGDQLLTWEVFTNGVLYASPTNAFSSPMSDFRLDTLAVSSYQDDGFGDTILAHGTLDNLVITIPPPPAQNLAVASSNGLWQVHFTDRTNWLYTLERSTDLLSWSEASGAVPGVDSTLILQDTNAPADKAFYRVRAQRP
jgi:hypothetical protein